jgi:hypothetical protein
MLGTRPSLAWVSRGNTWRHAPQLPGGGSADVAAAGEDTAGEDGAGGLLLPGTVGVAGSSVVGAGDADGGGAGVAVLRSGAGDEGKRAGAGDDRSGTAWAVTDAGGTGNRAAGGRHQRGRGGGTPG